MMRQKAMRWMFVILAAAALAGAQPTARRTKARAKAPLGVRIERIIAATPALARAHVGIRVLTLEGKPLYERQARNWFVPASNTKLYSTVLALARLGPDYRMKTRITAAAAADGGGVIAGDVRLVGGGDPSLSGRSYPYDKEAPWGDPLGALRTMAAQVAAAGVKRIDGDIVGDDTRYEWEPFPGGWGIDDPLFEYGAPVSALTWNDNALRVTVTPGAAPGEPAHVSVSPEVGQLVVVPMVTTAAAGERGRVRLRRAAGERELRVEGTIAADAKPYETLAAVEDPALYAARGLREALLEAGLEVRGQARARHRDPGRDPGPDLPHVLAEWAW
jgi:serine-type D-Ala-D-Ala carboxypeptidase/endopeptidase (penicillin-binding protein 4)